MQPRQAPQPGLGPRIFQGVILGLVCTFGPGVADVSAQGESLAVSGSRGNLQIDCDFPGGNIVVVSIQGDEAHLKPDLRDTEGWWFYWSFRVRGAEGRTLRFTFEGNNPIGVRGPAVSLDGGLSWNWLGNERVTGNTFEYPFDDRSNDVRFSFGMPYVEANLNRYLDKHRGDPRLVCETLCTSRKGRPIERLRVGKVDGAPEYRVLLTCRHHACEMMASYVLEGILSAILSETENGRWLCENVEFLVIPFMDKDGVEDGDQGKNRAPHDHNRDYQGESLYPSVAALRELVPGWSQGRLRLSMDLHCPWIRGEYNEFIYFPGIESPPISKELQIFSGILESVQNGPLVFLAQHNLPFGQGWNQAKNYTQGKSCARWCSELPGIRLASSLEVPYANASGAVVSADSARVFGHTVARAMRVYLESENPEESDPSSPARVSVSGVFPELAAVAEPIPRSEGGIGALMPWADRLWFITYVAHTDKTGAGTGLFEVDDRMNLTKRPESLVGTYANRMIHNPSNQLILGPHFIDTHGNVRTADSLVGHRLAATMEHLTDPETKVYFLTMEGLIFEVDVHSLETRQLFDLVQELEIPADRKPHFKSAFTGGGRVVVANNTYDERDEKGEEGGGRLAEWDGETWKVLEETAFTEVYGEKNLSQALFATGWDRASAILKIFVDDSWSTYRLPKGSHAFDHAWCTEWMRIREAETERLLMDCHGLFYELPYHLYEGKSWGIRPICTHLRVIPDFCSWRGFLVLAGNQVTPIGKSNLLAGQPQSNLWFGKTDDLWQFGKPKGWGGPWLESPILADHPSDPYLMTGFDQKVLHLTQTSDATVSFKVEVDFLGNQSWKTFDEIPVLPGGYRHYEFPDAFSAHWVRVTADRDCTATAYFTYN